MKRSALCMLVVALQLHSMEKPSQNNDERHLKKKQAASNNKMKIEEHAALKNKIKEEEQAASNKKAKEEQAALKHKMDESYNFIINTNGSATYKRLRAELEEAAIGGQRKRCRAILTNCDKQSVPYLLNKAENHMTSFSTMDEKYPETFTFFQALCDGNLPLDGLLKELIALPTTKELQQALDPATPLGLAIFARHQKTALELLDCGACPYAPCGSDESYTPLFIAQKYQPKIYKALQSKLNGLAPASEQLSSDSSDDASTSTASSLEEVAQLDVNELRTSLRAIPLAINSITESPPPSPQLTARSSITESPPRSPQLTARSSRTSMTGSPRIGRSGPPSPTTGSPHSAASASPRTSLLAAAIAREAPQPGSSSPSRSRAHSSPRLFLTACKEGHLNTIQALLNEKKINPDHDVDEQGKTSLLWAAENGEYKIMQLLLDHNANIQAQTYKGETILDLIPFKDLNSGILSLIQRGAPYPQELKRRAVVDRAIEGHFFPDKKFLMDIVPALLQHDIERANPLIQRSNSNELKEFDRDKRTLLHWAVTCNNPEAVQELLSRCTKKGNHLLKSVFGSKPPFDVNARDKDGMTALGWAKKLKYPDITEMLIAAGAKAN